MLKQLISDAFYGVKDSLSGWYVCYKCWHNEAHMLRDTPPPPKQFSYLAKRRSEQQKKKDKDGYKCFSLNLFGLVLGLLL